MESSITRPDADPARQRREGYLLDQAFTRAAGAPLVAGNSVRLLEDAAQNYPAWLAAIRAAERSICFENYIFREDETGAEFAAALKARARDGVTVRIIYDWMGGVGRTSRRFWRELRESGAEVRCFNPFRLSSPFDWVHRDHRKTLAVDGRIGFISGLCIDHQWVGRPERGIEPWRDTGIEIRGPAICDIERAFAQVWGVIGSPFPQEELAVRETIAAAGDVSMRILGNAPGTTGLFRLDQLIAAASRRTLWMTDAYFAGIPPYIQALRAAAQGGVDVRLLVPGASDLPILRPLSQSGYRPLLEAGIRVFEWRGTMLHAKTAVSDSYWARVGSSNLNIASWIGNYEMDAVIENEGFAASLEAMYLADLERATEIVLRPRRRRHELQTPGPGRRQRDGLGGGTPAGSASRAAAGALRLGRTVGAALSVQRVLEPTEARLIACFGLILLAFSAVALLWPWVVAAPLAMLLIWIGLALLARACSLWRLRRARGQPPMKVERTQAPTRDGR